MKRRMMKMAWEVSKHFASFAEAMSFAWKVIKLQIGLCLGIVKFSYKKIDGSIRTATGTLDNVPATKGPRREPNYGLLTYFDTEADGWRSAKIENLIFN
jgi:hypothetical protein